MWCGPITLQGGEEGRVEGVVRHVHIALVEPGHQHPDVADGVGGERVGDAEPDAVVARQLGRQHDIDEDFPRPHAPHHLNE